MPRFEPGTSCIRVMHVNHYTMPDLYIKFHYLTLIHIQSHTKVLKNWCELLLRQRFRQPFLDSPCPKIYGQYAKSRVQNLVCELDFKLLCI